MIDSRILGAHGSCALCLCVFALVLSLSTALIFVDADAASAYCVGDDGPADTRTWSAVSGAREMSQETGTTCDGLGDYYGRVNDWAPGNGKCAYIKRQGSSAIMQYDCDDYTSTWKNFSFNDADSWNQMYMYTAACDVCTLASFGYQVNQGF